MEQRRNQIVELVNRKGSISFAQLKEAFPSVSEMTLRTDLKALDEARRVVRVHGGVKSVEQVVGTDDLLSRRAARNAEAKQIIAEKAAALLRPNTTLFLDSGSTATAVARCIPGSAHAHLHQRPELRHGAGKAGKAQCIPAGRQTEPVQPERLRCTEHPDDGGHQL